jgi:hypothetical protein
MVRRWLHFMGTSSWPHYSKARALCVCEHTLIVGFGAAATAGGGTKPGLVIGTRGKMPVGSA